MKNKNQAPGKNDLRHRYHTRIIANVVYSALVAFLVEIFLVTNISMLAGYAEEARWSNAFLSMANRFDTVIVLGYVLVGIVIFDSPGEIHCLHQQNLRCCYQYF